jgi:MHS family proline/betaine transporter-like MFS transporter
MTVNGTRTSGSADATAFSQSNKTTGMQKRVLAGGSVGQFIEFYDFSLYGLSAVTLSQLFFPGENALIGLLATFATFGVAFIARPIGGFSAGGESVGAPAFVFEHAPVNRRGFWLNITLAATALPSVVAGAMILILNQTLSDEAFFSWGWRIPFLLALPLSLFGVWIRSKTEESAAFKQVAEKQKKKEYSPVREAFRENKVRMLQVVFVMGLTAMGFYFLSGYFVGYVQTTGNLTLQASLVANASAMLFYALLLPVGGIIGDKVGRKPMLIAGSAAIALLAFPCFMLVTSGSLGLAILGQLLFVVPLCIYGGGCYTFFVEIFTTKTRFTSAAVSYNLGYALFGGTAPFIGTALVNATGISYSPAYWLCGAAIIVFLLLTLTKVPETRGRLG